MNNFPAERCLVPTEYCEIMILKFLFWNSKFEKYSAGNVCFNDYNFKRKNTAHHNLAQHNKIESARSKYVGIMYNLVFTAQD